MYVTVPPTPLKSPHVVCLSITPTSFAVEPYVLHVGMYLYLTSYIHHSCRSVVCVLIIIRLDLINT